MGAGGAGAAVQGAGRRATHRGRVDLLGGLLECVCGRRLRSDGTFADGHHRKLHAEPCEAWGPKARLRDATWEEPVLAQLGAIQLDAATIALGRRGASARASPVALDRARIERQMRDLALDHVAERIGDAAYLARLRSSAEQLASLERHGRTGSRPSGRWSGSTPSPRPAKQADVPEAKAELIHAIYERIVVAGRRIVGARLTPAAYEHGLALALPEKVVMARPTGFEPATFGPEADALSTELQAREGERIQDRRCGLVRRWSWVVPTVVGRDGEARPVKAGRHPQIRLRRAPWRRAGPWGSARRRTRPSRRR